MFFLVLRFILFWLVVRNIEYVFFRINMVVYRREKDVKNGVFMGRERCCYEEILFRYKIFIFFSYIMVVSFEIVLVVIRINKVVSEIY